MRRVIGVGLWLVWLGAGCGAGQAPLTPARCLAEPDCPRPLVSAHRGLCDGEPENTLAAYRSCERLGVPMVEVDTRETADGAVVLMHDEDVTRTTDGGTRFPGRTLVAQLSLQEFRSLVIDDARCAEAPESQPERCHPATFGEVLAATGLLLDLDFKAGEVTRVAAEVRTAGAAGRVLFFDADLAHLRAYRAEVPGGLVMPRGQQLEDFSAFVAPEAADLELRWAHGDPATAAEAAAILHPAGVRLYLNGFADVDPWLAAAAVSEDPTTREDMLARAWQALDDLRARGADGFGTDFAARYVERLYPGGF
ncbi:MAG TPA: glycerophosphodiester phosphodiesterase family protein [Myxococcota bacterium]|nr:glycerophosphodiester phosphodiesterase family protein [Myxococcota bacterium]HRY94199.1 glycerophosphodiester phosphodiesterase family protein [Myxococcota bacterium]HSA20115.1 glycerophosphodiester phosphodiesterase family protein [Myxococcota bacterium]